MPRKAVNQPVVVPNVPKGHLSVNTPNGNYLVKIPTGTLGWKHFRLLMEVENERGNTVTEYNEKGEAVVLPNPNLSKVMTMTMDKWVEDILPHILVSHKFEDVPWCDILPMFEAVSRNASINTDSFRDDDGDGT